MSKVVNPQARIVLSPEEGETVWLKKLGIRFMIGGEETEGRDMYKNDGKQRDWRTLRLGWLIFTSLALTISVLVAQGLSAQTTTA